MNSGEAFIGQEVTIRDPGANHPDPTLLLANQLGPLFTRHLWLDETDKGLWKNKLFTVRACTARFAIIANQTNEFFFSIHGLEPSPLFGIQKIDIPKLKELL